MDERRKNPRVNVEIDVECDMSKEDQRFAAGMRDLSSGGICMLTKASLTTDSRLNLRFRLPESGTFIKVSGEMVWQERLPGKKLFATGIKFNDVRPEDADMINKYIDHATFLLRRRP